MINGINNDGLSIGKSAGVGSPAKGAGVGQAGGTSFAEMLKSGIEEVARLQKDASQAVEALATGKTEDVTGVMTAMEKSDLAFKTLLAIRSKLMDAYDEIKQVSV